MILEDAKEHVKAVIRDESHARMLMDCAREQLAALDEYIARVAVQDGVPSVVRIIATKGRPRSPPPSPPPAF